MSTVRKPKVGDKVLFFPVDGDKECRYNYLRHGEYLPATVTRIFPGSYVMANLCVFCDGAPTNQAMTAWRTSIRHKSDIDWPVYDLTVKADKPENRVVVAPHWIYEEELEEHMKMLQEEYFVEPLKNDDEIGEPLGKPQE